MHSAARMADAVTSLLRRAPYAGANNALHALPDVADSVVRYADANDKTRGSCLPSCARLTPVWTTTGHQTMPPRRLLRRTTDGRHMLFARLRRSRAATIPFHCAPPPSVTAKVAKRPYLGYGHFNGTHARTDLVVCLLLNDRHSSGNARYTRTFQDGGARCRSQRLIPPNDIC